jgi:hypothetical protein
MIRARHFQLKSKSNVTSWTSFKAAIEFLTKNKKEIESTFDVSAYDLMFNEPMNVIVLECDAKHSEAENIMHYAEEIEKIFADKSDKVVIDVRITNNSKPVKNRVYIEHTWFFKESI